MRCSALTHWSRATHISVNKLTIIGSDNGLSPCQRQAIIWTNAGILLIGHLGTNFSETLIKIFTLSFKKMHLKISSEKWWPFCLGLNVLKHRLPKIARVMAARRHAPSCLRCTGIIVQYGPLGGIIGTIRPYLLTITRTIGLIHKFHNAPVPYPTMQHSKQR